MIALLAAAALATGYDAIARDLDSLYVELHKTPELSKQEEKTAAKVADRLRALGYEVTTGIGGHGVAAVLKNGKGPTVMLRADLDGLPVEEKTGLPYASEVPGHMHACGHDAHMTSLIGAATLLARNKKSWRGTLLLVVQPAEEVGEGAKAMLADGLFTKFPKPDFAVMVHVHGGTPAGEVRYVPGYALANVDSVDLVIHGRGGHGASPHLTVDPIVIAARTVVSLQTIVAREIDPTKPAVVTVGSIHGGTKHNIIPDSVTLQLTVRSYDDGVREKLLASIKRIAEAEAQAAGAPKMPEMKVERGPSATFNDPALVKRLLPTITAAVGANKVAEGVAQMGAEDFSEYGRAGVKATFFWVGASDPQLVAAGNAPSTHSPLFAPVKETTLRAGTLVLTASALELLAKP